MKRRDVLAKKFWRAVKIFLKDAWANRTVILLLVIFGVSVRFGISEDSDQLQSLAAASGAALVGLLAPPPGNREKTAEG